MPKPPVNSSALSLQNVNQALESISQLTPPEKLLLYLKLPTGQPAANPLKSPVNPLGSRFEITQTINWVRTHFVEDKNVSLPKQNIYAEYLDYCTLNGMKPLSTADFGKVMKQVFPEVRPRRLGTRGNSRYCYSGLGKRSILSSPYLPEDLGEELDIQQEQSNAEASTQGQIKEEEEKQLNGAYKFSDFDVCESDSLFNGLSAESTKLTGVSGGDSLVSAEETHASPVPSKSNSANKKRKQFGPSPVKKDQAETKRRKPLKKSSTVEEITNHTKDEQRTSICDIEHFPSLKDKSLTSYNKSDLDISSDLNSGKCGEPFSKVNRSYSVELPSLSACRTSRTVSVDMISDYDLISSNLETVCNPFGETTAASSSLDLQDSGISSTQEPPLTVLSANLQKSDNTNTPAPDLNSFVSSQSVDKLPLPRLRPMKMSGPSQVANIIILPSNVIKQSAWPQRQYKRIQPRPEKDISQNFGCLDKKIENEHGKFEQKDEPNKDILQYDGLPKLESLRKDAFDTYLNGEGNAQELDEELLQGNSQELEEELLQYFKPDFSSTEIAELSDQVLSLNHNDSQVVSEKAPTNDVLGKVSIVNGVVPKTSVVSKSSVPFYHSVSVNEVHQLTNRCMTEFQMASSSDLVLPSPSGSIILQRQASFDSGVRDLETPLNIPPSPNTRCKLFDFTPISPRPSSPRENSKSSCDTSIQSPFISPRSTPICARTPFTVSEISNTNAPPKQYPARLRSASTSCKSNSLISNPSPTSKKTQDLPSFKDLVKMSKPKLRNNQGLQIKNEPSGDMGKLPPISPLSTPDSPVFSFSEVRKDSPLSAAEKIFPASENLNGHLNPNNDFSSHEIGYYFSKDTCFNFDFYKNRSKSVPVRPGDDTFDKMLTYNDPIVSSCASDSGNEQFISRRRDVNSLQSFLQSDPMPSPLDCLLGDVDMGLNGLSSDGMDVFSATLPPIPTD